MNNEPKKAWLLENAFLVAAVLIPINAFVWINGFYSSAFRYLFWLLALSQFLLGGYASIRSIRKAVNGKVDRPTRTELWVTGLLAGLVALGGPFGALLDLLVRNINLAGGAWGRPLRIRGRVVHPELRIGSDWAGGAKPNVESLDMGTRLALEALWLHDAQKEHASVPAFSRVSWQLAAVGASPGLIEWAHRAALQEIDHARRCFALAAGYGGRTHTAEPMPELLLAGLEVSKNPLLTIALESLKDGCLLEDFNSDVAGACKKVCEDPAARELLDQIEREERSHADLSWAILDWLIQTHPQIRETVRAEVESLMKVARPTAVPAGARTLYEKANPKALRQHGRIDDSEWEGLWKERLRLTTERAELLLRGLSSPNSANAA